MLPSSGGRRLVVLIRRTAVATAGNPFQPQPPTARFSHRYFSTPAATAPRPEPYHNTVSYLVNSCGLSPAAAAATAAAVASRRMRISTVKADANLALLRRHGFSDAQIALLLRSAPNLLIVDADKIIRPKLEFFDSLGIPIDWLLNKPVLERSLNQHIIPSVEFLRGILGTNANIRTAISRHPHALLFDVEKKMRPALQALRRHGLSEEAISKLVLSQMGVLRLAPNRIAEIFEHLEELGIPSSDSRFVRAYVVMSCYSREAWLRKVALYRSLGVSEGELREAFKTQPSILALSEETIKRKLRFFLDELKFDLSDVMRRPVFLAYSLEKCILPRCAVLSVLMREGKIKQDVDLFSALTGSSKIFIKKYVSSYAGNVPDVIEAYEGKIKFEGFQNQMV
ncbi:hypothetical protein EJB05_35460, partial [Eragrostis curvula]